MSTTNVTDQYLSSDQFARKVGVSRSSILTWVRAGEIHNVIRFANRLMIPVAELSRVPEIRAAHRAKSASNINIALAKHGRSRLNSQHTADQGITGTGHPNTPYKTVTRQITELSNDLDVDFAHMQARLNDIEGLLKTAIELSQYAASILKKLE